MAIEIKVPDMGESVIEATIARWMKQEGERVAAGEPVVELETDKINLEVGAQQAGVLQKIARQAGENVAVGDVLAYVAAEGEAAGSAQAAPAAKAGPTSAGGKALSAEAQTQQTERTPKAPSTPYEGGEAEVEKGEKAFAQPPAPADLKATPVAQRMAQELGIDLGQVTPSGAGGRVTKEDVEAYTRMTAGELGDVTPAGHTTQAAEAAPTGSAQAQQTAQTPNAPAVPYQGGQAEVAKGAAQPRPTVVTGKSPQELSRQQPGTPAATQTTAPQTAAQDGRETRVRMTRRRQTIARRLVEAQHNAAMLTTFNEIDISKVMELRKRRREGFKERFGVDLGFMSFFVKAAIGALKAFPYVNAEIALNPQGDEIILKHYYDIGVAIGAPEGLVVPVIRDADRLNFAGVEKAIKEFANKAKDGTLTLDDLRGGTFTITNGGVYGSLMSTPILNPPQVAILGMHAIKERPMVVNGEIVIRPMMYVALSYDHRIVDGREAVQFLVRIKELVEDPEALLFG